MSKILSLTLSPENAAFDDSINNHICKELNANNIEPSQWKILKKSIDARKKEIKIQLKIEVFEKEIEQKLKIEKNYKDVSNSEEVIIIGSGPAGLFAALTLLERGKKPIVIERGKDVRSRRRDIAAINKNHIVRAALESIAFQIKDYLDDLEKNNKIKYNDIYIDGGIVSNKPFMQLLSNTLQKKIHVTNYQDMSSYGALMMGLLKVRVLKYINMKIKFGK